MTETQIGISNYPFKVDEDPTVIYQATTENLHGLITDLSLGELGHNLLFNSLMVHYNRVEDAFLIEEWSRLHKEPFADLYYHKKEHALYQATFDTVSILRGVLGSHPLSSKLSVEGIVGSVMGMMNHDIGYVDVDEIPVSFAARTPIHVEESMKSVEAALRVLKLPGFLDRTQVTQLAKVSIHATHFPYTPQREEEGKVLVEHNPEEKREEGYILRDVAKLADLGGQCARVDTYPRLLKNLRAELNSVKTGLGVQIIGEDHELGAKFIKFMEGMVLPYCGEIAKRFLGEGNNFQRSWDAQMKKAKSTLAVSF